MDNELFYRIKKDLCQWDPVDLVTITSEHEYDIECKAIASELQPGMGVFQIATIIRDVLMKHFGDILPANKKNSKTPAFQKLPTASSLADASRWQEMYAHTYNFTQKTTNFIFMMGSWLLSFKGVSIQIEQQIHKRKE